MSAHETLLTWENFYIIVGSSAGALTGLQFVVIRFERCLRFSRSARSRSC